MNLIRELKQLLEDSKHGDTWAERFRRAVDVTGGPITQDGLFYYKHKTYKTDSVEVWYFSDHQDDRPPMDISQLHDDPEIQARLRAKIPAEKEPLPSIETFVVFHDGHSYAMWFDYDEEETKVMIDWDTKSIGRTFMHDEFERLNIELDDPNTLSETDVLKYVELVKDAYH